MSEGIDGQLMLLRQLTQAHTVLYLKPGVAVAHQHAAAVARVFTQERPVTRDVSGLLETLQVALPPVIGLLQVALLQPADVIAVARRCGQLCNTAFTQRAVNVEEVAHQQ